MTIQDRPFWANERGKEMRALPRKPHERELTLTDGSSHVKIFKHLRAIDTYTVRVISHHKLSASTEQVDRMARIFSGLELATAFDREDRDLSAQDLKLAAIFGAEFSVKGKFARRGQWLSLFGPGSGQDGDSTLTVYLRDDIRTPVRNLMNANFQTLPR